MAAKKYETVTLRLPIHVAEVVQANKTEAIKFLADEVNFANAFNAPVANQHKLGEVNSEPNPKDANGRAKLPLSLVPHILLGETALAFYEGKLKYGEVNWRATPVYASVYIDAMMRHAQAYSEGEDRDSLTRVHHLANMAACAGIIMDAQEYGTLIDDRKMSNGNSLAKANTHLTEILRHLNGVFEDKNPRHFKLADSADFEKGKLYKTPKGRNNY